MKSRGKGKRTVNIPENPEEYNALLEFPTINPYDSFLMVEDEPETKRSKKEKSRKEKRKKNKKSSKKEGSHKKTSKTDPISEEEEISPWPVEWQRATETKIRQYEDSDDSPEESDGDERGNSRHMPEEASRDENAPACSFWGAKAPVTSEKETSSQSVDRCETVDSNTNRNLPVESEISQHKESLSALCQISPEHKSQILHSSNSAAKICDSTYLVCPQSDLASVSHQAGGSQNFYGTASNTATNICDTTRLTCSQSDFASVSHQAGGSPNFYGTASNSAANMCDTTRFACSQSDFASVSHQPGGSQNFYGTGSNSAANMCDTTRFACSQSDFVSVSHQAGGNQNLYGTADKNSTEYSGSEGSHACKRYIGGRVARSRAGSYDVNDVSSQGIYTHRTRDRSGDNSFKNSQGDDNSERAATNLTEGPMNYGCVAPRSNSSNDSKTAVAQAIYDHKYASTISSKEPQSVGQRKSETPAAPPIHDSTSSSRIESKKFQISDQDQIVAPYLSQTPLNICITADNRGNVLMQPSHQSEDAQGFIHRQNKPTVEITTIAAADKSLNVVHGNTLCDIIIRDVPVHFVANLKPREQIENQGAPSGNAQVHVQSKECKIKGSITITIDPASHLLREEVPTTPRGDTNMCSPSNEESAHIRQKPHKDNKNLADEEMTDESSDDNQ